VREALFQVLLSYMFTGIVSNTAIVKKSTSAPQGLILSIKKPEGWDDLVLGESIATNGVCLTISEIQEEYYECILVPETLNKTVFGTSIPDKVNLERSLKVYERFGGHFVQGHVDCVGDVINVIDNKEYTLSLSYPDTFNMLVIPKGSICINGVSLTIAKVTNNTLNVALIHF
jgi:riboflavin synthase